MEPPKACFLTKIYHPNIDDQGQICLNILNGRFNPSNSTVVSKC